MYKKVRVRGRGGGKEGKRSGGARKKKKRNVEPAVTRGEMWLSSTVVDWSQRQMAHLMTVVGQATQNMTRSMPWIRKGA
jgi:hypothetical protein